VEEGRVCGGAVEAVDQGEREGIDSRVGADVAEGFEAYSGRVSAFVSKVCNSMCAWLQK
jgi:hypothetical protein